MLPNFVATAMGFQWITWISLCGTNFSCQAMNTFQTIIQTNSRQCITLYNSWEIFCVKNKRVKIFSILFIFYVEHDRSTNTAFGLNGLSPKSQHTWQQKIPTHMAAGGKGRFQKTPARKLSGGGGGSPLFPLTFFPLGFREPTVRGGGRGGTPPFR